MTREERFMQEIRQLLEVKQLANETTIANQVARIVCGKMKTPIFNNSNVPVEVAAEVFKKDAEWVKAGIIVGWLPIGVATKRYEKVTSLNQIKSDERTNYYISPKRLWEVTGFIWDGGVNKDSK